MVRNRENKTSVYLDDPPSISMHNKPEDHLPDDVWLGSPEFNQELADEYITHHL